jgi:hypothetical protein
MGKAQRKVARFDRALHTAKKLKNTGVCSIIIFDYNIFIKVHTGNSKNARNKILSKQARHKIFYLEL